MTEHAAATGGTSARIAIVGCGGIGFRHLQAVIGADRPVSVDVIEPSDDNRSRASKLLEESSNVVAFRAMPESPQGTHYDLAVVATGASQRRAALDQLLSRCSVGSLILEKVLFQTIGDLDAIGSEVDERAIPTFVNYGRRTFAGYRELVGRVRPSGQVRVTVDGSNWSLASNGLHFFDLAEFLTGSRLSELSVERLDPGFTEAKRLGTVEVTGTMVGRLRDGTQIDLTSAATGSDPLSVRVETATDSFVINEADRTISDGSSAGSSFGMQNVSETTWVYYDLIDEGVCELTPYAQAADQHRYFLGAVRSHLGISNVEDDPCPIS